MKNVWFRKKDNINWRLAVSAESVVDKVECTENGVQSDNEVTKKTEQKIEYSADKTE